MRRAMMLWVCLVAVGSWTAAVSAAGDGHECKGCAKIKEVGHGFCEHCHAGKIYGVKLTSKKMYDVLAGSEEEFANVKSSSCKGCKEAAEHDGACEHCHVFVANHKVFSTKLAQALARGMEMNEKMMSGCPGCKNAAEHGGFCEHCNTGVVAHQVYKSRGFYESAAKAFETVKAAIKDADHCEMCAIARMTDGKCEHCRMEFKDGKPI